MENFLKIQKEKLLKLLIQKGISDTFILDALARVPREYFVPKELYDRSYEDNALPIICNQTISQPYTVAFMTMLIDVLPEMKILEIGTGSGYQAAVLSELGVHVYSVELIPELYDYSKKILQSLNYFINQKLGDGTLGWEEEAPFDRIIVTAGAPRTPQKLLEQLKINGKMVIPIGDKQFQTMNLIEKISATKFKTSAHSEFRFVPLIGKEGWIN